ncbi:hypothetical protein DEO72_LG7g176 [Vigna unguiculata]|uniref:Uncharacterized protein n=1 Tax=Vigna unguiculata TaxID=3917 RepID=A0A4D6MF00_VIGUN|nr:hypothetical protein DEO72_LG7g176 [Vigna unguiculata]
MKVQVGRIRLNEGTDKVRRQSNVMTIQTLKEQHWDLKVDPNLFSLFYNEAAQFIIPVSFILLQLTNNKKNRAKHELSQYLHARVLDSKRIYSFANNLWLLDGELLFFDRKWGWGV